jgi:hypothetical protein
MDAVDSLIIGYEVDCVKKLVLYPKLLRSILSHSNRRAANFSAGFKNVQPIPGSFEPNCSINALCIPGCITLACAILI